MGVVKIDSFNVPGIGDVAKNIEFNGKSFDEMSKMSYPTNQKILTLKDFVKLLNYSRKNIPEFYGQIIQSKKGLEFLDTSFNPRNGNIYVASNNIEERLSEGTLIESRRISLEGWINDPTDQGLPKSDVDEGTLVYCAPPKATSLTTPTCVVVGRSISELYLSCLEDPNKKVTNHGMRTVILQ